MGQKRYWGEIATYPRWANWGKIGRTSALFPCAPGPAVDHDHRRKRPVALGRPGQVELELGRAGLGVDDVLLGVVLGGSAPRATIVPIPAVRIKVMFSSTDRYAIFAPTVADESWIRRVVDSNALQITGNGRENQRRSA